MQDNPVRTFGMRILEGASSRIAHVPGLSVRWHASWGPPLDEALAQLPPMANCSHELFRGIAANPSTSPKRHAVVLRGSSPAAVISLRRRQNFWELVTESCVPLCMFPVAPSENPGDIIRALGVEIRLGGVEADPMPLGPWLVTPYVTYQADLRGDFEKHWRSAGRMTQVRKVRKQTEKYAIRVDHPGDVEWHVATSRQMWQTDPQQLYLAADDQMHAWPQLREMGRLHSVVLVEGTDPVASNIMYVDGKRLLGLTLARDKSRVADYIGSRLFDVSFHWGAEAGYDEYDLGGWLDYKRWWAPAGKTKYQVVFRPKLFVAASAVATSLRNAEQQVRNWGRKFRPS